MDVTGEPRQVVADLSTSVSAFAAVAAALEAGLLDLLVEPCGLAELSARTGLDVRLVERLLDVLVALGLLRRDADVFSATPGLLPMLQAKDVFLAELRSTYLQNWHLIDGARHGRLAPGWTHTDPDLLDAQGRSGRAMTQMLARRVFPNLPGLQERLQAPGAAFLDVGAGVGVITIELCRLYPNLHAVGIEPQDAPLAEARRNVAAAHLEERVELRQQRIEDLADSEAFDYVFLPSVFLPVEVFRRSLQTVFRALRRGGWVSLAAVSTPGADLEAALSRLRNVMWGGDVLYPEQIAEMVVEAGFANLQIGAAPGSQMKGIAAQRPA